MQTAEEQRACIGMHLTTLGTGALPMHSRKAHKRVEIYAI